MVGGAASDSVILAVPVDEPAHAVFQSRVRSIPQAGFGQGVVGGGVRKVAGLQGQQLLGRRPPDRVLDLGDVVGQLGGNAPAQVEDAERGAGRGRVGSLGAPGRIRLRDLVGGEDNAVDDVVDVGEGAAVAAVVADLDRPRLDY